MAGEKTLNPTLKKGRQAMKTISNAGSAQAPFVRVSSVRIMQDSVTAEIFQ